MKKSNAWFKKVRWSYLPKSKQGWLAYLPFIAWLVFTAVYVDRSSHSISDTIIGVVPYWVSAAVIMHWFASHKS